MSDELTIDGEQFVSSKRASEFSGYEQDYIGQLARGGHIKARRVGGLWYISVDSLTKYKEHAEEYKPEPPLQADIKSDPDSLLSFDGKAYVSAPRAAKLTGYNPDYVGQLARDGIILSRQVGKRWYVERGGIIKHKESKDALLGAVQAQSVGLRKHPAIETEDREDSHEDSPLMRYVSDNRELLPSTGESADFVAGPDDIRSIGPSTGDWVQSDAYPIGPSSVALEEEGTDSVQKGTHIIPIRIHHGNKKMPHPLVISNMPVPVDSRSSMLPMLLPVGLVTIVIVLSFSFLSLKKSSTYTSTGRASAQIASVGATFIGKIGGFLEKWLVPELIYQRAQ